MPAFSYSDILSAAEQISDVAVRTSLIHSPALDEKLQGTVYLKAECLQRKGAFKFRGAYNAISRLPSEVRASGVVACSSGNHAQGVAEAARLLSIPAAIVMPSDAPEVKVAGTRSAGAEVVFYDRETEDREAIARSLCEGRGASFIHPFNDPRVMAGQGTAGLEIANDLAALGVAPDLMVIQVSGGGLASGVCVAMHEAFPQCEIWGVEPEGHDDLRRSLMSGERCKVPGHVEEAGALCDALLAPMTGSNTFPVLQEHLKGGLAVSDEAVLDAVAYAFSELRLVVEPGGAIGLAALLSGQVPLEGRSCVVMLSGGNIDPKVLKCALAEYPALVGP